MEDMYTNNACHCVLTRIGDSFADRNAGLNLVARWEVVGSRNSRPASIYRWAC